MYCDLANYGLCVLIKIQAGDSLCNYSVAIRVNRVMLVSLCAETMKPVFEENKSDSCGKKCISISSEPCKSINR